MDIHCFANGEKNGALFRESFRRKIKTAFFYPSDLVNTKTTILLRVGEEQWIYTSTLRVSVYIFSNSLIIHKVNYKSLHVYHITCMCLDTQ